MERVTVKSTSIKRGSNEKGDWVNTQITPTEGRKWTGFIDGLASLKEGDVIDITEYEEGTGNKYNKILKYEKAAAGPVSSSETGKPDMTNEMWAETQKIERDSIENQTRAERITELWIAGKIKDDDQLISKLKDWLNKLGLTPAGRPKTTADEDFEALGRKPEGEGVPPLKNVGELFARAAKFGLSTRDVCEAADVGKREDITDFDAAWVLTAKKFAGTIKKVQEEGI